MKRKLSLLLISLMCIFGLCACSQSSDPAADAREAEKNAQYIQMGEANGPAIIQELAQYQEEGMLDQLLGQDDELDKLVNNYVSGMEDVGNLDSVGDAEATIDGNNIIVDIPITGTKLDPNGNPRTANVQVIFDTKGQKMYPDLSVNPKYTSAELMEKAGLNTLLGMGVTFSILILISLIISSFTLISKAQNKPKAKEENQAEVSVDNAVRQIEAIEEQQVDNDDELIAVIAAAIAAYESETGTGYVSADGVVIRSVRKVNRARWQNA